jgi:3-hydroxypropanoate dehydrogenase
MDRTLDTAAWNLVLAEARTYRAWLDRAVDETLLRRLYDLTKLAPTAMNNQPLRVLFVQSQAAKDRLRPALDAGNVAKTMSAPVTAILACDADFGRHFGKLAPHAPQAAATTAAQPLEERLATARTNTLLQAGYFILTARGLGLDCGPMAGFDGAAVDASFWSGTACQTVLLVNLGYGDASQLHPRAPRLDFDEACRVV